MYLGLEDFLRLIHPAIAVTFVFPMIGITVWMAWQTRQRRLQVAEAGKSRVPPGVGQEHVRIGQWLTGGVVGLELLGLTRPLVDNIITKQIWSKEPTKVVLITLLYVVTISSLVFLYRSSTRSFRAVFATLTGAGIVILSLQDGVYRRSEEWYLSHLYFGITVTLLMVFSLAILPEIYRDRSDRWRTVHIVLNSIALVLFLAQGLTGTRDLLEIPLSWQEQHIYQCDYKSKACPPPTPPKAG
ncbi:MAG TPA: DUF4079 domain-containing protein [Thermosynechococcaceae cyanobacterium]